MNVVLFGVLEYVFGVGGIFLVLAIVGLMFFIVKLYRKVDQGTAIVRNGWGGTKVSFSGMFVLPMNSRSI